MFLYMSKGYPKGMSVAHDDNIIPLKKYKENLFFNTFQRAEDQMDLERATDEQCRMRDEIIAYYCRLHTGMTLSKVNMLNIKFKDNNSIASSSTKRRGP